MLTTRSRKGMLLAAVHSMFNIPEIEFEMIWTFHCRPFRHRALGRAAELALLAQRLRQVAGRREVNWSRAGERGGIPKWRCSLHLDDNGQKPIACATLHAQLSLRAFRRRTLDAE